MKKRAIREVVKYRLIPVRSESQLDVPYNTGDNCYILKGDIASCMFVSVPVSITSTIAERLYKELCQEFPEKKIIIVSENINFLRLELIK